MITQNLFSQSPNKKECENTVKKSYFQRTKRIGSLSVLFGLCFFMGSVLLAQSTKHQPTRTGDPLPGLTERQIAYFNEGKNSFEEVQSVTGTEPGAHDAGLGPRFNLNSCGGCHAQPAVGGTSPQVNPQVEVATHFGAQNTIPYFVLGNGPVREAHFIFTPSGNRDGGVQDLYVITGRFDAKGCNIQQPDFNTARIRNNIVFRIPTPVFGAGLIESIPDNVILENKLAQAQLKKSLGIVGRENRQLVERLGGTENRSANDGTISRFGWKAQNKSLQLFAAEAYNVEQGVTNDIFPNERDDTPGCVFNGTPENIIDYEATDPLLAASDATLFTQFMRLLAPPPPKPLTPSAMNGKRLFVSIGCALCHTPSLRTGPSSVSALSNKQVNLFSDLLLHSMGPGLADNIIQGKAGPDDFRTAPLWGVSERLFFLHDGRTNDLMEAILAHASTNDQCSPGQQRSDDGVACNSEANAVIQRFQRLVFLDQQDIINFLRAL